MITKKDIFKNFFLKIFNLKFFKFSIYGLIIEVISFSSIYFFIEIGFNYTLVITSVFFILSIVRFIVYNFLVFRVETNITNTIFNYLKFVFFRIGFLFLNIGFFYIFYDLYDLNQGVVQLLYLITFQYFWYLANRYFIFK